MRAKQNQSNGLQYVEEHLICENYASGDNAIIGIVELKANKLFIREDMKRSTLVFVLSGSINISTGSIMNQTIEAGNMFLVPAGSSFYGKAITATVLMRCFFTGNMALCNKFTLKNLLHYLPEKEKFTILPIHDFLRRELELTRDVMRKGLLCIHFQHLKAEIIFLTLRGFYTRQELASLFEPILATDGDFKDKVLQLYPKVNSAKELIRELNMSPTAFKQKFKVSFGISAKQWLIQKKKEKLFRDIVMTDYTVIELADKYNLTVNYLTTFCKKYFGKTPTELRLQRVDK